MQLDAYSGVYCRGTAFLDDMIDATAGNSHPRIPEPLESAAWILSKREGRTQAEIAVELGVDQSTVSRMIKRADAMIWDLVRRKLVSLEALETELRGSLQLNPRT